MPHRAEIDALYRTDCPIYGDNDVPVKYFLWVKAIDCEVRRSRVDFFPAICIAEDARHPATCWSAGTAASSTKTPTSKQPGKCRELPRGVDRSRARASATAAPAGIAATSTLYPTARRAAAAPAVRHRVLQPARKARHNGRFFKKPDAKDIAALPRPSAVGRRRARASFPSSQSSPATRPTGCIAGATSRYRELFNDRQLLGLEHSAG